MANDKKTPTTEADTLESRIAMFFKVQPYGEPQGIAELNIDLPETELKAYIPNEEADAIVKRMVNDKFAVPEKKEEQRTAGRMKAVEIALNRLVESKVLEKKSIVNVDKTTTVGYVYTGDRTDADAKTGTITRVPIDQIKVDDKLQCREKGSNESKVAEYAANAHLLPAVRAFKLPNGELILSRGFTRMKAWKMAGMDVVPVEIIEGTKEDAKLDAIGDNAEHGLPRTVGDIFQAIGKYLSLPGKKNASIASIAAAVKCAWATARKGANKWRKETGTPAPEQVERGGNLFPANLPRKEATGAEAPASDAPQAALAPTATPAAAQVFDKVGNPVPAELVGAFTDQRFDTALKNIRANMEFLREFSTDGYSLTAIPFKERSGLLNEMEFHVQALRESQPYAVNPDLSDDKFASLTAVKRRGWMTKTEYEEYQKIASGQPASDPATPVKKGKGGKKKTIEPAAPAPTAEPASTTAEPAAPASEPVATGGTADATAIAQSA